MKLGRFDMGLLIIFAVLTAFGYSMGHFNAKYGTLPKKSLLLGDLPGTPPHNSIRLLPKDSERKG